jgi:hypothetical protein
MVSYSGQVNRPGKSGDSIPAGSGRRLRLVIALALAYLLGVLLGVFSLLDRFYVGVVVSVAFGVAMVVLSYVLVRRMARSN